MTHTIRTTEQPWLEQVVDDAEFEYLLDLGLIYDGTPPVEPADPFDTRVAARLGDPDSATRTAVDGLVSDAIASDQDPTVAALVADSGSATYAALQTEFDVSGAAASAQAFAIQRANHTGTQPATTITGLAIVATSGAYTDLSGKPTIPTVAAAGTAGAALSATDPTTTNARTPTAHTHPAADIVSGTLPTARLGSGTPAAGTYVDGGTGAWTTLPSGTGAVDSVNGQTGAVVLNASDVGAVAPGDLATVATTGAYSDLTGKPTIPPAYTDEQVRDVIGAALVAGANVTITPDDAGDTITIAAAAGGGGTTAALTPVQLKRTTAGGDWTDAAGTIYDNTARAALRPHPIYWLAASGAEPTWSTADYDANTAYGDVVMVSS